MKMLYFQPVNLGLGANVTRMSHCWRQEGHPTKRAPIHHMSSTLHIGISEPL